MQLYVRHRLDEPLEIPVNHNQILQAVIYASLGGASYKHYMHDQGFSYKNRKFKLFTFGTLSGEHEYHDKKLTFTDTISFEIRSPDPFFIRSLKEGIENNGIRIGEHHFQNIEMITDDVTVESEMILVDMVSPVTVYSSDPETKYRYYYSPIDSEFEEQIVGNFYRKYYACYGVNCEDEVRVIPYNVRKNDRIVTNYKGQYITAYKGQYVIAGHRKCLDFMYQTGLGAKNAQGFGMFDIISEGGC